MTSPASPSGSARPPIQMLTVWQPWATLIAGWPELDAYAAAGGTGFRPKRIENRDWAPPARLAGQLVAIHAGRTYDNGADAEIRDRAKRAGLAVPHYRDIPAGAIIAVCEVVGFIEEVSGGTSKRLAEVLDVASDITTTLDTRTREWRAHGRRPSWAPEQVSEIYSDPDGWWLLGTYGWLLDNVVRLPKPIACKGRQGLMPLYPELVGPVLEQVEAARGIAG